MPSLIRIRAPDPVLRGGAWHLCVFIKPQSWFQCTREAQKLLIHHSPPSSYQGGGTLQRSRRVPLRKGESGQSPLMEGVGIQRKDGQSCSVSRWNCRVQELLGGWLAAGSQVGGITRKIPQSFLIRHSGKDSTLRP